MNQQRLSTIRARKLVPAMIGGLAVAVDLNSIDKSKREIHHGEFNGTKVNSPATLEIGDSIGIWPEADKKAHFTMTQAGFGVTAIDFLEKHGYTVTKNS